MEQENKEVNNKKKYKSTNKLGVRIMAGILAFLMLLSVSSTVIFYLFI